MFRSVSYRNQMDLAVQQRCHLSMSEKLDLVQMLRPHRMSGQRFLSESQPLAHRRRSKESCTAFWIKAIYGASIEKDSHICSGCEVLRSI